MSHAQLVERAKSLIDDLARTPRFAGSAEEAHARVQIRAELERAGFMCREIEFEYSQWLGRWGPPVVSILLALIVFAAGTLTLRGALYTAPAVVVAMYAAVRLSTDTIRRGWILDFPWLRTRAKNLEAKRGQPRVWLIAHVDSKSQTMPMLLRILGAVALQLSGALVFAGALAFLKWGEGVRPLIVTAQLLAAFGAIGAGLCFVTNRSPGAVDNASGVAAVTLAAQSGNAPHDLGVLITSGEELGLAGALAWGRAALVPVRVLNCDTIDEVGEFRCMYTGRQPMPLTLATQTVAKRLGDDLKTGHVIPGLLADSIAFAVSGWPAITLSRGTLATLARIHTTRDNSAALTGEGTARASLLLSAIAKELS